MFIGLFKRGIIQGPTLITYSSRLISTKYESKGKKTDILLTQQQGQQYLKKREEIQNNIDEHKEEI